MLQPLRDDAACLFGLPLERLVLDELIREVGELVPGAAELARQTQRDDAVVEQLEADAESVHRRKVDGGPFEPERRLLILDVGRRGGFGRELRADAAADGRAAAA